MNSGLHPNDFFILESCSRKPQVHFLLVARQVCFYFTAHTCFKKISLAYPILYLSKCVQGSTCFSKIPTIAASVKN